MAHRSLSLASVPARPGAGAVRLAGWVALVAAAVACVASVIYLGNLGFGWFTDWATYDHAVERFLHGQPLYAPFQLESPYVLPLATGVGFIYPPPAILLFVPFALLPGGQALWVALNVGLLVTGLAAVLRRELGTIAPWPLALTLFGLALFVPFGAAVASGEITLGFTGILAWAWTAGGRRRWVGPVSGVGAVVKVQPGILVAWAWRVEGWRGAARGVAVGAAICLVTLPLFGLGPWFDYLHALSNTTPYCDGAHYSVACTLVPFTSVAVAKAAGIAVAVLCAIGVILVRNRTIAFALLAAAMLAPVTDMHWYYLLTFYVVLVVVVATSIRARRERVAAVAA